MDAAVVPGHLVPAEVISEHEDDVGSGSGGRGQPSEGQRGEAGPQHGRRSLHTRAHGSLITQVSSHKRVTGHTRVSGHRAGYGTKHWLWSQLVTTH